MPTPKLLCIGAQKAGTSWLHESLAQHPDIWVPPFKELHFFDHKFLPAHRVWTKPHVARGLAQARARAAPRDLAYLDGLSQEPILNGSWYKRVFAPMPAGAVGFDATPEYGSLPAEGIRFLTRFLGADVKVIYLIRDPLSRVLSQLRMNLSRATQMPQTPDAWAHAARHPDLADRGNYAAHITRWQGLLPPEQMLFLPFGDIARDPTGLMRRVERFAGLRKGRYRGIRQRVFPGPDIQIPPEIVAHLHKETAAQVDFLKDAFGPAFAAACYPL